MEELYALMEQNTRKIERFVAGHGIPEDAISISPPVVTDLHAQSWGDKQHIKFRYTAVGSVTVYMDKVEEVRAAMSDVVSLGRQGVAITQSPHHGTDQFLFTELTRLKPGMIEEATKNARVVTNKFAADSNSRLGKIRSARQGQFSITNRDSTTPRTRRLDGPVSPRRLRPG